MSGMNGKRAPELVDYTDFDREVFSYGQADDFFKMMEILIENGYSPIKRIQKSDDYKLKIGNTWDYFAILNSDKKTITLRFLHEEGRSQTEGLIEKIQSKGIKLRKSLPLERLN